MKVLALTRYDRLGASSRVRTLQYLPALAAAGIEVEVQPLLSERYLRRLYAAAGRPWRQVVAGYAARLAALAGAGRHRLLWIEKELFPGLPAWAESALSGAGWPLVADYDDAVHLHYTQRQGLAGRLLGDKIGAVMRAAAVVVCGNEFLADHARAAGARDVRVLPSVVDLDRYRVAAPPAGGRFVVGWIGSPSTVAYLDRVLPALRELGAERPLQLRVVGARYAAAGVDVDCRPWSEDTEVAEIQGFDVGIMPLHDSPWERGKCGFKLIQCMACGKPVVASPVGVNSRIVTPGVNGFLAAGDDEWAEALRRLAADAKDRQALGSAARETVERGYSLQVAAPRLVAMLRDAAAARR
jgi:glycosyltransferase involved in cell wall biosynthesis